MPRPTSLSSLLNASRGLIFPVRWHEPFGLAVIESLYFGCPVFATPYGALPELVQEVLDKLADGELSQPLDVLGPSGLSVMKLRESL